MFLELDPTDAHLLLATLATRLRLLGYHGIRRPTAEESRCRALVARIEAELYDAARPVEGKVAGAHNAGRR